MNYSMILLLAVIQGLAEMLPVSSSAHVILTAKLVDKNIDPGSPQFVFLLILLHTGTMFAAIIYFWSGWKALFVPSAQGTPDAVSGGGWHFLKMVIFATAVTGILGYGLKTVIEEVILKKIVDHDRQAAGQQALDPKKEKREIEHLSRDLRLVGAALFVAGVLILLSSFFDRLGPGGRLTTWIAVAIGAIQALCLPFRGLSRSGATISVGLFCGLPRRFTEQFSFALAVALTPAAIAYEGYKLIKNPETPNANLMELLTPGLIGMIFSFLAGLLALRLLSSLLEHGHWRSFAWYCFLAAGVMFFAAYKGY